VREYENLVIITPEIPEDEIDKKIEDITSVIKQCGGQDITVEKWGMRTFAYPIKKKDRGFYVLFTHKCTPKGVNMLQKALKSKDYILRFNCIKKEA